MYGSLRNGAVGNPSASYADVPFLDLTQLRGWRERFVSVIILEGSDCTPVTLGLIDCGSNMLGVRLSFQLRVLLTLDRLEYTLKHLKNVGRFVFCWSIFQAAGNKPEMHEKREELRETEVLLTNITVDGRIFKCKPIVRRISQ